MDIQDLRQQIDQIDFDLIALLKTRMEVALKTKKFKADITDSGREDDVVQRVRRYSETFGLLPPGFSEQLFRRIMEESKKLQSKGYLLAGFQGEHGAYSEVAARRYNSKLAYIPCIEFADVFEGVEDGHLDIGVVPVENTLGGAITQVNELLIETSLNIVAEISVPIHHCLLTLPETDYREIRVVYSHPQARTQCRDFLTRNNLEPHPYYDTAGAAKMIAAERPKASAAIGSKLCAEMYNLEVIKEDIEDHEENKTRFLILSRNTAEKPGNKSSVIFSAAHKAGSLFEILRVFAENRINLTRIESMPNREDPGNYYFFLDFEGNSDDEKIKTVLEEIQKNTMMYKFLGCYGEVESK